MELRPLSVFSSDIAQTSKIKGGKGSKGISDGKLNVLFLIKMGYQIILENKANAFLFEYYCLSQLI